MKIAVVLLLGVFLPACATVQGVTGDGGGRMRLWEQAHEAYSADSFRVAATLFQRLANEHPRTHEGHESRFYIAALSMEPRSNVDLRQAEQQLALYLADDSLRRFRGYHGREGETLLAVVRELQKPCGTRVSAYECVTRTQVVERPGEPVQPPPSGGPSAAEVARLRRELAERDNTIRELREELQRIRSSLAPRQPR